MLLPLDIILCYSRVCGGEPPKDSGAGQIYDVEFLLQLSGEDRVVSQFAFKVLKTNEDCMLGETLIIPSWSAFRSVSQRWDPL